MPESSLALQYKDLKGEVGLFLGYGRGADFGDPAWSTAQTSAIDSIVRSGLRQFYWPPPLDQKGTSYDWSFLKPTVQLGLASGASVVTLPDDFGGFEGRVTLVSSSASYWPVDLVGEGLVRAKHAELPSQTGAPQMIALRPLKGTGATAGQRFELYVWPIADQAYTLAFQYYVAPDYLDTAFPYHWGGAVHSETVLESCLAIAEQRLDDASAVHSAKFQERLAASVAADRKFKSQSLGYNNDLSDGRQFSRKDQLSQYHVTVNGVLYAGWFLGGLCSALWHLAQTGIT